MSYENLVNTLQHIDSIFCRLLKIPILEIFNGIILQQVNDYQAYAHKLLIDYLLSSENNKTENESGATTRAAIDDARQHLLEISDKFSEQEICREQLINESQKQLIKYTKDWKQKLDLMSNKIKISLESST